MTAEQANAAGMNEVDKEGKRDRDTTRDSARQTGKMVDADAKQVRDVERRDVNTPPPPPALFPDFWNWN